MNMIATVLQVNRQGLLVRDEATGQEVQVNIGNPNRFSVGERIRITFSGQMTSSIPPQISATSIQRLQPIGPQPGRPQPGRPQPGRPQPGRPQPFPPPGPAPGAPSELRGIITQRGNNFLTVRENRTNRIFRVEYVFARHFCTRQQVIVRYNSITLNNPPRITATDITPVC